MGGMEKFVPAFGMPEDQNFPPPKIYVIMPFYRSYRRWQIFLVVLVAYSAWASPFELAFETVASFKELMIIDLVVNVFFAIDIIISSFVAYIDNSTQLFVIEQKKIAARYFGTITFAMDMASVLPLKLINSILTGEGTLLGILSLLRLWRLRHVATLFARLEKDTRFSYLWTRIVKIACVTLFALHSTACLYCWVAYHHQIEEKTWLGNPVPDFYEQSIWFSYIYAIYFSISTLTTVGYGNLYADSNWEKLLGIILMLFNIGLTCYLIGNMTNLVVHEATRTSMMREATWNVSQYAKKNQLPKTLQTQMIQHMQLKFKTLELEQEVLTNLPKALRMNIAQHLFGQTVDSAYLFKGVSKSFTIQMASEMQAEYFPPKADIIQQKEISTEFYIVVTGELEVLTNENGTEKLLANLGPTDMVGEIGVILNIPQPFTIRSKSISQVVRISHSNFKQIVELHIAEGQWILSNFLQFLEGLRDELLEEAPILMHLKNSIAQPVQMLKLNAGRRPMHCSQSDANCAANIERRTTSPALQRSNVGGCLAWANPGVDNHLTSSPENILELAAGSMKPPLSEKPAQLHKSEPLPGLHHQQRSNVGEPSHPQKSNAQGPPDLVSFAGRNELPKRVVIYAHHSNKFDKIEGNVVGKFINLPDSIEKLLILAGKKFGRKITTILTIDGAEVEELNVVRDGDKLFVF